MTRHRLAVAVGVVALLAPIPALAESELCPWSPAAVTELPVEDRLAMGLRYAEAQAHVQALKWLQSAAAGDSAEAMIHLGYFYQHGYGVEPDGEQALHWFERGVMAGESAFAQRLAWDYLEGDLVEPDRDRAEHWFQVAIADGRHEAHLGLGSVLLADVAGGDDDRAEDARDHFEAALDEGLTLASYYLARMYREGLGIDTDEEKALHYLTIGAESGDPQIEAVMQAWLAEAYHEGQGMGAPDPLEAAKWGYLAAANGHPDGDQLVAALEAPLNDEEIRDARRRALAAVDG